MTDKFRNTYRISSPRLSHWDYGANAMYFVTICTKNRECYFGDITDEKMQLSEIGLLAQKYWLEIPNHFPFVVLDEFVVMPDHVHGIIVIDKTDTNPSSPAHPRHTAPSPQATPRRTGAASQKWNPGILGVIRNQYKRMVTIRARKIHADFGWQPRFHDHIIRNDSSFQRIRNIFTIIP